MSKLLMISGDRTLAEGKHGAFYNTLEEFHKYWDRIDIICPRSPRGSTSRRFEVEPLFGNVFIHPSPWSLIFQIKFIFKKGREIFKQHKFDLVTVHEYAPFYNGLGAYLLHCAIHVPYIMEIMHIPGVPKAFGIKEKFYRWLTKWFIAFDVGPARAIRIINQIQTKDFLIDAGVPESKLRYIPAFYIDFDVFKPEALDKKYDLIFVTRLEKNKGVVNLIEAVAILKKTKPDIKLLIIGQGPELENLKLKTENLRLENNIFFSGWLAGPHDIARYLNQSRIFVNPSLNEGGPRVVLEAMACGLPVVTTRVGIMLDIIEDGKNGVFCDWKPTAMAQAIERMLDDKELQTTCIHVGQETVRQFEKKSAIKNYADRLQSLI